MPDEMGWGEAWRLLQILVKDPSSQIAASVADWDAPRSREWFALADLYDLTHKGLAGKKKTTPYPRPTNAPKRRGRTAMSRDEVIAVLNRFGHDIGKPPGPQRDRRGRLRDERGRYVKG